MQSDEGEAREWNLARAQNLLGITMAHKGNISVALDYYLAGIKNCREHNETTMICGIHSITEPMPLLDLFDDLERLCVLLLEIGQLDVFLHIVDQLQNVVASSEIMDVGRRLLALRIEYYRVIGDNEEYMKATGWFYELVRTMDKEYNDNYGHQAGDECIQAIASLLKKMEEDETVFCARYGGDEFIIIYSGVEAEDVRKRAEQLRQDVIGLQMVHEYSKVYPYVTISQGICQAIPISGNKSWDFLHEADEMLYNVKRSQRNSICVKDFCNLEEESKC